jgi:DNA-binding NarL/FixJ family response regulator
MNESISIYLVDDHRIFTQSFQVFITLQDRFIWRGSSAGDRRTVMDILLYRPMVVLLDYHLNRDNGIDLLRQLRTQGYPGKIVFLTMNRDHQIRAAAKAYGADGFISKDIDGHDLLDGIRRLVTGSVAYLELPVTAVLNEYKQSWGLTPQERKVAEMICAGLKTDKIADTLSISIHTVYTHRKHILEKTGSGHFMEVCSKLRTETPPNQA